MADFVYDFDWDVAKAKLNARKHHVTFDQATEVFGDPLALTIADEEHSGEEARWITLGRDRAGNHLVVVHTFRETHEREVRVRLISARKPTRREVQFYEVER